MLQSRETVSMPVYKLKQLLARRARPPRHKVGDDMPSRHIEPMISKQARRLDCSRSQGPREHAQGL